jgi:hypothetical protein
LTRPMRAHLREPVHHSLHAGLHDESVNAA